MTNRWLVLALLFSVRATMAFQFQAVATLSPFIMERYGVGIADIGFLIGLYFLPGIALAYPGGALGKRFGDKPCVLAGLAMMACGGLVMAVSGSWELQVGGRLLAGIGGVLLNVLMTKMVADWFAGREIATAMGIFVNSWPFGIALALLTLPTLAETQSLEFASLVVAGLAALGFVALAMSYRAPASEDAAPSAGSPLGRTVLTGIVYAGLIWGLYNAALGMVFGFAPTMLVERGWPAGPASSVTSVVLWVMAVAIPLAGFLADRIGRNDLVLATGLALFGTALLAAARTDAVLIGFVVLGIVAGLSPGPIMSLPSRILDAQNRAFGMGVFYTVYYIVVVVAPMLAGSLADTLADAAITFDLGAVLLAACGAVLVLFRMVSAGPSAGHANGRASQGSKQ